MGRTGGGTGPSNVNLKPPKISETTRARMLKLKNTIRYCEVLALGKKISPLGGVGPPSVNLGPLISRKIQELES